MKQLILLTAFYFISIAGFCQGMRPGIIEADRPSKSETTKLVPVGFYQLEAGIGFERDKVSEQVFTEYHFPEADFRTGINDFLELRIHAEGLMRRFRKNDLADASTATGIARTGIGAKARLWKAKGKIPEAAFLANVTVPLGSPKFNHKAIEPEFRFIFFNRLTEDLSLNYTIGLELEDARHTALDERKHKYDIKPEYALCLNVEFTEAFFGFLEVYGEKNETQPFMHASDLGIAYRITPNVQVDFSAGFGLTENAPQLFLDAGFSLRLPR